MMASCFKVVPLVLLCLISAVQSKPVEGECPPGEYLDPELNNCQKCEPETFSSTTNQAAYCDDCRQNCFDQRNTFVVHYCNSTHDMLCQCKVGYFAPTDRSQCKKHAVCPENCLKHLGSPTSNAICYDPCPATTSLEDLPIESSTGSTAEVMNYNSFGSLASPSSDSDLPEMTTSSSNQTTSNNFLVIGLPIIAVILVILTICLVIIRHWKKLCECLKLKRACGRNIYQAVGCVPLNGEDHHLPLNRQPPQPPPRNASVSGNGDAGTLQHVNETNYKPTRISFRNAAHSHGALEPSLDEPLLEGAILPDAQLNEDSAEVPGSQILPLEPEVSGETLSDEVESPLLEPQLTSSSSCPSLHHGVTAEAAYAQVRLMAASSDVQDSLARNDSEDLGATSNLEDLRVSQTMPGAEDCQDLSPRPCKQDNCRISTRPCARVQPTLMLQPDHPQANHAQPPQANHAQPPLAQHMEPNDQPGVPNQVVENAIYEAINNQWDEVT